MSTLQEKEAGKRLTRRPLSLMCCSAPIQYPTHSSPPLATLPSSYWNLVLQLGSAKLPPRSHCLGTQPSRFILRGEKTHCLLFLQSRTESQLDWCPRWNCGESIMCAEVVISVDSGVKLLPFESWLRYYFLILLCLSFLLEHGNNNSKLIKGLIWGLKELICRVLSMVPGTWQVLTKC